MRASAEQQVDAGRPEEEHGVDAVRDAEGRQEPEHPQLAQRGGVFAAQVAEGEEREQEVGERVLEPAGREEHEGTRREEQREADPRGGAAAEAPGERAHAPRSRARTRRRSS